MRSPVGSEVSVGLGIDMASGGGGACSGISVPFEEEIPMIIGPGPAPSTAVDVMVTSRSTDFIPYVGYSTILNDFSFFQAFVSINLILDVLHAWLDPRIRLLRTAE